MTVANYWLFLILIPFLVILFLPRRIKHSLGHSLAESAKERKISKIFRGATLFFWVLAVFLLVFALVRPQIDESLIKEERETREIFLSVDVSTSMGVEMDQHGKPDPDSGISKIKVILKDFAQKRRGDLIGISAYSGQFGQEGGAGIISVLTPEYILVEQGINSIRPKMFGLFTAVGEGLFVSLFGLVEREIENLEKERKYAIDISQVRTSLRGEKALGDYAYFFANSLRLARNKVIILFTDGFYNTGINPLPVLRLLKMMNIRVYFVAVRPTSATGVSKKEGEERKLALINAARETGGEYFDGENYEEVKFFFSKIDEIEKAKVVISQHKEKKDVYFWPALVSLLSFILLVFIAGFWIKIP